jgi:hypothetical protein
MSLGFLLSLLLVLGFIVFVVREAKKSNREYKERYRSKDYYRKLTSRHEDDGKVIELFSPYMAHQFFYLPNHFFKAPNNVKRYLPFLSDHATVISNDDLTLEYENLRAAPDFIASYNNEFFMAEFKSNNFNYFESEARLLHMMQLIVSAYTYMKQKNISSKELHLYLCYLDSYIYLAEWEVFVAFIDFVLSIRKKRFCKH